MKLKAALPVVCASLLFAACGTSDVQSQNLKPAHVKTETGTNYLLASELQSYAGNYLVATAAGKQVMNQGTVTVNSVHSNSLNKTLEHIGIELRHDAESTSDARSMHFYYSANEGKWYGSGLTTLEALEARGDESLQNLFVEVERFDNWGRADATGDIFVYAAGQTRVHLFKRGPNLMIKIVEPRKLLGFIPAQAFSEYYLVRR